MRVRSIFPLTIGLLLVGMASLALCDNYFANADLKEGSQAWHGDGRAAFLKPDGTEGDETDPGVIPVLKLTLAKGQPRSVYQEFNPKDAPGKLHIKVQVFASLDFKRSTHSDDYLQGTDWPIPTNDFVIRLLPDYFQQTADLKRGEWVTVEATYSSLTPSDVRGVYFIAPPGDGIVYLKNPSVTP